MIVASERSRQSHTMEREVFYCGFGRRVCYGRGRWLIAFHLPVDPKCSVDRHRPNRTENDRWSVVSDAKLTSDRSFCLHWATAQAGLYQGWKRWKAFSDAPNTA